MTESTEVERWAASPKPRTALWEVEERVLLEHPGARRWPSSWRWLTQSSPGGIVQVALFLAPIGAAVAIVQTPAVGLIRRSMDEGAAVPLAGVCYLLSIVLLASTAMDWFVDGRPRDAGSFAAPGITLVSAAVALALAGANGIDLGSWSIAAWTAGGLATLLLVVMLVGSVAPDRVVRPAPVDVERLDTAERVRLLGLRGRVLATLAERSLIDASLVEEARSVPLGALRRIQPRRAGAGRDA